MSIEQFRARLEQLKRNYPKQLTIIRSPHEVDVFMQKVGSNMKRLEMKGPFDNGDPEILSTLESTLAAGKEIALQAAGSQQILILIYTPKTGGCFIATAAYGSALAPEVVTFRQFRDDVLLQSLPGTLLIALYYRMSPLLARVIAKSELLRRLTRRVLRVPLRKLHGRRQARPND